MLYLYVQIWINFQKSQYPGLFFIDESAPQTNKLHKKEMLPVDKITIQIYKAISSIYHNKDPDVVLKQLYDVIDALKQYEHTQNKQKGFTKHLGGLQFVMQMMGKRSA